MKRDYSYIILGLGGIGSGALYWLSRSAGSDVLGLEQYEIGHVRGGSQDHSRIIRLSYHTPEYVELAKHAYKAWATLEADAHERLIVKTGGLDLAPPNAAIPISDYTHSLTTAGVAYEWLDAAEVMRRWPQFRLGDDIGAIYQADSGIALAARCNAAHLRLAHEYGATLLDNMSVTAIRNLSNEIEVVTRNVTYRCHKLVIAGGAWTNQLLAHFGLKLPLTITQEQVTYYATPHAANFAPDRFPIWIWMDEPCYYGFPVYGEAGPKIAQDVGGQEVTAETRTFEPNTVALQRLENFLKQYLPTALGPQIYTKTCLYTLTPDRDFIIDTLPQQPNIAIAVGAGHAFKFASLIGKILSEFAIAGHTGYDTSPFKISRPILLEENPAKRFVI
jgi:sarcosine oxidase